MNSFSCLAKVGSSPLSRASIDLSGSLVKLKGWGKLGAELLEGLREKNGFYAFESALLLRPLTSGLPPLGILEWNDPGVWKAEYAMDLSNSLFFAEDIFGVQFGITPGYVKSFDPETGKEEEIANSVESWAETVRRDYNYYTGWSVAHEWQIRHGAMQAGVRLLPKVPFFCGGQFQVENLYVCQDVKGMRFRASIATQIKDIPDGTNIVFRVREGDAPSGAEP